MLLGEAESTRYMISVETSLRRWTWRRRNFVAWKRRWYFLSEPSVNESFMLMNNWNENGYPGNQEDELFLWI